MKNRFISKKRYKIVAVLLVFTLWLGMSQIIVQAEEGFALNRQERVKEFLDDYFNDFLETLLDNSSKDFSSEDFSSVNGYIAAKALVTTRECDKLLLDGIRKVNLREVVLDDLTEKKDCLEAVTYVNYVYLWGNESDENACSVGALYRVTLKEDDNKFMVLDLDNIDNVEIQMAKELVNNTRTRTTEEIYQKVDAYFDTIQQNTRNMLETNQYSTPCTTKDEDICVQRSTNVSYTPSKARNWGNKFGNKTQNYIFKRASEDCTNFVSQCVWAGYGGADGYSIPSNPRVDDATCVALKNRVASNYRMTSTWYGRNYDSPYGDPPSQFCGVEAFCTYVTSNSGVGPRATVYNNNSVYTNLSVKIKPGDVLQFYNSSLGRYRHSVIVVSQNEYGVADYSQVRVAQHSGDYNNRPLSELISGNGGSSCKMRLLRFKSTEF